MLTKSGTSWPESMCSRHEHGGMPRSSCQAPAMCPTPAIIADKPAHLPDEPNKVRSRTCHHNGSTSIANTKPPQHRSYDVHLWCIAKMAWPACSRLEVCVVGPIADEPERQPHPDRKERHQPLTVDLSYCAKCLPAQRPHPYYSELARPGPTPANADMHTIVHPHLS